MLIGQASRYFVRDALYRLCWPYMKGGFNSPWFTADSVARYCAAAKSTTHKVLREARERGEVYGTKIESEQVFHLGRPRHVYRMKR